MHPRSAALTCTSALAIALGLVLTLSPLSASAFALGPAATPRASSAPASSALASPALASPAAASPAAASPAAASPAAASPAAASLATASPAAASPAPRVRLRGGELVDAATGAALWRRDPATGRPMGSITKVLTALVVLRAGNLGQRVTVSRAAVRYVRHNGASSAGLAAGDSLTVRQLLRAMLIPSGCDAAFVLATAYGPGRAAFVAKMNATAASLGMTASHFTSFDGMPFPTPTSTYASPVDLIRLGQAAMRYPLIRRIVAETGYSLPRTHRHHAYSWVTTDLMLGSYPGMIGIKTGDTNAAGFCLLFEARRAGRTLIGVVLHANPSRDGLASAFRAATALLNWGFQQG